jgi:hypothetical protein
MPYRQISGKNSGQFLPGQPRPVGSGRRKGTPNKQTALVHAGVKAAIQTCREGGMTPIEIMCESARFIHAIADLAQDQKAELIQAMDRPTIDWVVDLLVKASDIAAKAAPFGFPRLAAIEHVGDPLSMPAKNKVVVTLKIGHVPRPAVSERHGIEGHVAAGASGDAGDNS